MALSDNESIMRLVILLTLAGIVASAFFWGDWTSCSEASATTCPTLISHGISGGWFIIIFLAVLEIIFGLYLAYNEKPVKESWYYHTLMLKLLSLAWTLWLLLIFPIFYYLYVDVILKVSPEVLLTLGTAIGIIILTAIVVIGYYLVNVALARLINNVEQPKSRRKNNG